LFAYAVGVEGRSLLQTAQKFLDFEPTSLVSTVKNGTNTPGNQT